MSVYVNNIVISAGSSFSQDLTLTQSGRSTINLTGYGISSYIRKHPESITKTAEFIVGITSAAEGKINIFLPGNISAPINEGRYVYDILAIKPSGDKNIIVEGNILVRAGISS
jgi:hypothetical protein